MQQISDVLMVKQVQKELADGPKLQNKFMKLKFSHLVKEMNTWEYGKLYRQQTAFTDQFVLCTLKCSECSECSEDI